MCNLYSITTNQEAMRSIFRKVNRYVGNLAPMTGVFPGLPGTSNPQRRRGWRRLGDDDDALGHATSAAHRGPC
jgi:hypothetical protein